MNLALGETLQRLGCSPAACAQLVQGVTEAPESHLAIQQLKERISENGASTPGDKFERELLASAAVETAPRIEGLRVHEPVKSLIREEFQYYTNPSDLRGASLAIGSKDFVVACKTISLSRFPSGPLDWEISGFPRSWLLRIKTADLPKVLKFLFFRVRGFGPLFFVHVARRPKNRSLLIEKEVLRSYYRMARSLELQPQTKGILASAWFHDPAAMDLYPHLKYLNQPYLNANGLIVTDGFAPPDSGFMEQNEERREQFAKGELRLRIGIAIWPRTAAIQWANEHSELAG